MELRRKTTASLKWNTVATVIVLALQILQMAILTHFLEKSDFGLIAIASLIIAFTDIFSELGITAALIHKQNITKEIYSSVFWLNIFMSFSICLATISVSPIVSEFYNEPKLTLVISLLSLKILFCGFGKMFQTIKVKNLEFGFISKVRIITAILGVSTSTSMAYLGHGVMSIVFGQLVQVGVTQSIFSFAGIRGEKILFHFSIKEIKDVLSIGGYQLGTHLLDFIASRIDVMLIGRFFTMSDLGVYNIAKDLINMPFQLINSISSNVFSSAFAKIQHNTCAVVENYIKLLKIVSILTIPLFVGLFTFADLVVSILYAPAYKDVAVFVRIMSLIGICSSITSQGAPIMIAKGRTDLGLRWTIVRIILNTTVLFITASLGVYFVAAGQTALSFVSLFVYFVIVIGPLLENYLTLSDYIKIPLGIFVHTIFIAIPIIFVNTIFHLSIIIQIILACVFVMSYYLYIQKTNKAILNEMIETMTGKKSVINKKI